MRGFDEGCPGALGKVECVVFQGSWDQPTAARLISSSRRRMRRKRNLHQRRRAGSAVHAAFRRGIAADLEIDRLAALCIPSQASAADVFEAPARRELCGMTYDTLGLGQLLAGIRK
jgi:hypothetical protein